MKKPKNRKLVLLVVIALVCFIIAGILFWQQSKSDLSATQIQSLKENIQKKTAYHVVGKGFDQDKQSFIIEADFKITETINEMILKMEMLTPIEEDAENKIEQHYFFDYVDNRMKVSVKLAEEKWHDTIFDRTEDFPLDLKKVDTTQLLSKLATYLDSSALKREKGKYALEISEQETIELLSILQSLTSGAYNDILDQPKTTIIRYKLDQNKEKLEEVTLSFADGQQTLTLKIDT